MNNRFLENLMKIIYIKINLDISNEINSILLEVSKILNKSRFIDLIK
jgi:hypothetical protein